MKWHFNTILLAGLLCPFFANAQQALQGKTVDRYNKPIDNVYISNRTLNQHTHTDSKGSFSLESQLGDTIEISHILYEGARFIVQAKDLNGDKTISLTDKTFELGEVLIKNEVANLNVVTAISLETTPVNSSQELLRQVPGLIIGQHSGGGKAEQMFLRGFDVDHGTDIRISVDDMPVNMVSHAHGQGYADLHFLIPETVQKIDFGKGPYYTQQGNLATAGYVNFNTKDELDYSAVGVEFGRFNTMKVKGLFNLLNNVPNHKAYLAATYRLTDGAFNAPQNFNQVNIFGKYTWQLPNGDKMSFQAGGFYARWDASGQIPERAVQQGLISRFGAIDSTEGGQTSRANVVWNHTKLLNEHSSIKSMVYYSNYKFQLFSNFTFFLKDSIHGDQIRQSENRNLVGGQTELQNLWHWNETELNVKGGFGFRYDDSNNNGLAHTYRRKEVLNYLKLGNIDETNFSGWIDMTLRHRQWTFNLGVRLDYFRFGYLDLLDSLYRPQSVTKIVASPKLNVLYTPSNKLQFYFKTGVGFHTNDTRVVVAASAANVLPIAIGADIGTIWKPYKRLVIDAALWTLYSQQEMVYVGDEAIVEPSGQSLRAGVDCSFHLQLLKWLFADASINYAHARIIDEPKGANYIPLAVDLTSSGGLSIKHPNGISAGVRYRIVKDRPANEDNTIIAKGYGLVDCNVSYQYKRWGIGLAIDNLFNAKWNETQFATETRLKNEATSTTEIHFTPGTPFFIKGQLEFRF